MTAASLRSSARSALSTESSRSVGLRVSSACARTSSPSVAAAAKDQAAAVRKESAAEPAAAAARPGKWWRAPPPPQPPESWKPSLKKAETRLATSALRLLALCCVGARAEWRTYSQNEKRG